MNPLLLTGWGIKIKTENLTSRSFLTIFDGRLNERESTIRRFAPRRFPYSSILLDGFSGYISMQAIHWLARNGTPVYVLDLDGRLLSVLLPASPVKADARIGQIHAADDPKKKFQLAKLFVEAKVQRSLQVLDWIEQSHDVSKEVRATRFEANKLKMARTVADLRITEGRIAQAYWRAYSKAVPRSDEFQGRMTTKHNNNASDPVNCSLNYGYGFLEAECRKAINAAGLESSVGFLHDFSDYQTKESLVYDVMEPFRWLVDLSVLRAFQSRILDWPSFYFTANDYRYRFTLEAKKQFIAVLKEQFNRGVPYRGQRMRWDSVIQQKVLELSRFFVGKSPMPDFEEPSPNLERFDSRELRERINSLTSDQAKRLGIGKSTLHYLRKNASHRGQFTIYKPVMTKLSS